jgi:DNA-binding PadR family transcriptional regulator
VGGPDESTGDAMSMKYAVLGLLAQRRGYGYDLVQRFEEQIGSAWQLNAGAIYVALDKLEQEGLVRPVPNDDGAPSTRRRTVRGAPRVIYEATPNGLDRFEEWMSTRSTLAPLREELHLKLALSRPRNLERLIEVTYEQEQACLERLEQSLEPRPLEELLGGSESWPAIASVMVRDAEVAHLQATVQWLRRVREGIRTLQERPEGPSPQR